MSVPYWFGSIVMKLSRFASLALLFALLVASTVPAFAAEQKFALDPYHTQVRFSWNHSGFSNPGATIHVGKGMLVWNDKDPSQSSVSVTMPVASIDTLVPALNGIFQEKFFEAEKYPTVTFKSTRVQQVGVSDHYVVEGQLTVHGVTRPVTLDATLNKVGEAPMLKAPAIGFDATTIIKRSAFGLGQYVPLVSDQVRIRITVEGVAPEALAKEVEAVKKEGAEVDKK